MTATAAATSTWVLTCIVGLALIIVFAWRWVRFGFGTRRPTLRQFLLAHEFDVVEEAYSCSPLSPTLYQTHSTASSRVPADVMDRVMSELCPNGEHIQFRLDERLLDDLDEHIEGGLDLDRKVPPDLLARARDMSSRMKEPQHIPQDERDCYPLLSRLVFSLIPSILHSFTTAAYRACGCDEADWYEIERLPHRHVLQDACKPDYLSAKLTGRVVRLTDPQSSWELKMTRMLTWLLSRKLFMSLATAHGLRLYRSSGVGVRYSWPEGLQRSAELEAILNQTVVEMHRMNSEWHILSTPNVYTAIKRCGPRDFAFTRPVTTLSCRHMPHFSLEPDGHIFVTAASDTQTASGPWTPLKLLLAVLLATYKGDEPIANPSSGETGSGPIEDRPETNRSSQRVGTEARQRGSAGTAAQDTAHATASHGHVLRAQPSIDAVERNTAILEVHSLRKDTQDASGACGAYGSSVDSEPGLVERLVSGDANGYDDAASWPRSALQPRVTISDLVVRSPALVHDPYHPLWRLADTKGVWTSIDEHSTPSVSLSDDLLLGPLAAHGRLWDVYTLIPASRHALLKVCDFSNMPASPRSAEAYSRAQAHRAVHNEIELYYGPLRSVQGEVVPRLLSAFELRKDHERPASVSAIALVMEDAGLGLDSFLAEIAQNLPEEHMAQVIDCMTTRVRDLLRALHQTGVVHGDAALRHVRCGTAVSEISRTRDLESALDLSLRCQMRIIDFDLAVWKSQGVEPWESDNEIDDFAQCVSAWRDSMHPRW